MTKPTKSRVIQLGRSQAVRIPQEFRLEAEKVEISRNADGDLLIRQLPETRSAALRRTLKTWPDHARAEFVAAMEASLTEQPPPPDPEAR